MFNEYPYTDFHELNLDWVISTVKAMKDSVEGIELDNQSIHEQLNTLASQLANYIQTMRGEIARQIAAADIPGQIDSKLAPYLRDLNNALAEVERLRAEMDTWDDQIRILRGEVEQADNNIRVDYNTKLADLEIDMLFRLAIINERIDNIQFELPEIYNLVKGYKTNIAYVIYDVYDALRYFAYTALQFTNAGYTAQELDDMLQEALELDINGYPILYGNERTCINPLTGMRAPICAILQDLALFASTRTWTALIFDGLSMDATTIDAKDVTAFDYDYSDAITI